MSAPLETVAILGLGQMGTSVALAMREYGIAQTIIGYDAFPEHALTAKSLKAAHHTASSPEEAVKEAQLVVLCTPVGTYSELTKSIAPHLLEGAIITDIGSVKLQTIRDVEPHLPNHATFVPSHPIAGSEKTGPTHAKADFFQDHLFLTTPAEGTPVELIELVSGIWDAFGARTEVLPPDVHDHIYAYMSHLPQLMAFATAPLLAAQGAHISKGDETFTRFVRIGRSDPHMWHDVFLENEQHIIPAGEYIAAMLRHMLKELREGSAQEESSPADAQTMMRIWPKIMSSVLVTTVQQAGHQLQRQLLRYAAGGFIDFSASVLEDPENDLALISKHAGTVCEWLEEYLKQQDAIIRAVADHDSANLMRMLSTCQESGRKLVA